MVNRIDGFSAPFLPDFAPLDVQASPRPWAYVSANLQRSSAEAKDTSTRPILASPQAKTLQPEKPQFKDPEATLLHLMRIGVSLHEEKSLLDSAHIKDMVQKNRKLNEEMDQKIQDRAGSANSAYLLGWARRVINTALVGTGVVSAALLLWSGPLALPPMLVAAQAFATMSSGVATGAEAIYKHKKESADGEMFEINHQRTIQDKQIQKGLKEIRDAQESIAKNWEQLRDILDNIYQSSLNMRR